MSGELCGVLSPEGVPCDLIRFAHGQRGPHHSWELCTSMLVLGFPQTRCQLDPGHEEPHEATRWRGP